MEAGIKSVYVTKKASLYASGSRANLRSEEIIKLVQEDRMVFLGKERLVDFMLAWDPRKKVPIILLVARSFWKDAIISIWEPHYRGIPNGSPTEAQIQQARELSITLENPPPD